MRTSTPCSEIHVLAREKLNVMQTLNVMQSRSAFSSGGLRTHSGESVPQCRRSLGALRARSMPSEEPRSEAGSSDTVSYSSEGSGSSANCRGSNASLQKFPDDFKLESESPREPEPLVAYPQPGGVHQATYIKDVKSLQQQWSRSMTHDFSSLILDEGQGESPPLTEFQTSYSIQPTPVIPPELRGEMFQHEPSAAYAALAHDFQAIYSLMVRTAPQPHPITNMEVMVQAQREQAWDSWYRLLLAWRDDPHGGNKKHANVPQSDTYHGQALGQWLAFQRLSKLRGDYLNLSPEHEARMQGLVDAGQLSWTMAFPTPARLNLTWNNYKHPLQDKSGGQRKRRKER